MINLSDEQQKVVDNLLAWYFSKADPRFITVGGFAGTGKTTVIAFFRQELHKLQKDLKVSFCSYTGKATRVLKSSLTSQQAVLKGDYIGTIHSLIYSPLVNSSEEIIGWERKDELKADLIVIDEASMVDEAIWNDLLNFKIPIIAIGDHGQLPPISGKFNLMQTPKFRLEQIFRQAKDNPIIDVSVMARKHGQIPVGKYSAGVQKLSRADSESQELLDDLLGSFNYDTLVLCGYNTTRVKLNQYIRNKLEIFNPTPQIGDRVICLRNNHKKGIYNGMLGNIVALEDNDEKTYHAKIAFDEDEKVFSGPILKEQFNSLQAMNFTKDRRLTLKADLFDFGYAITVHKAQGSQAKRVILLEERFAQMDEDMWRRWLYTAVTRAQEELYVFGE